MIPEEEQEETLAEGETTLFDLLDSGYEWTEGVNPNIDLYSGKILDENNETTVDMVVEGIDWELKINPIFYVSVWECKKVLINFMRP